MQMLEIFQKLTPVLLTFGAGILLRVAGVVNRRDAEVLLRIVFYAAAPALILSTVSRLEITASLAALPFMAASTYIFTFAASNILLKKVDAERGAMGAAMVGAMIMNIGFLLPFIIAVYGSEGFARAAIFDSGNAVIVFSFAYYTACRYGKPGAAEPRAAVRKLLTAPPLWAIVIAFGLNFAGRPPTGQLNVFLEMLGAQTITLVLLALGVFFEPAISHPRLLFGALAIRIGVGLFCGAALSHLFGLTGLTRTIVILCSAAPVGYNTLTYSSLVGLDTAFAANLLSCSIAIGIPAVPLLMMILDK